MKTRLSHSPIHWILIVVVLLVGTLACGQSGAIPTEAPAPAEPTSTTGAVAPTPTEQQITTINGPEGMILTLQGQALTPDAEVTLEVIGETDLPTRGTPFATVGPEYRVSFGEGDQIGGITLTVPFSQTAKLAAPAGDHVNAAWARPDKGLPSMVGVIIDEDMQLASLPIVGAGRYQIVQIARPDAAAMEPLSWEPLSVPSYPQRTPAWCSPTALTNLAGYHQGAWPSGGYGGEWGESSNWYLAGLAGQPYSSGYFFHWLLKAGGYSVPSDVKQSFFDGNSEVIIWNWGAFKIAPPSHDETFAEGFLRGINVANQRAYARELFVAFRAYVENHLWGTGGPRRPVAWGSSLAGHSRTITGSDGENLFFNNPTSGSFNDIKSWNAYEHEVIDSINWDAEKTEVIDTVVFYADPRPVTERRGVLWLEPWSENREGSIVLRRGEEGTPTAYWHWDGALEHDYGYYYEGLSGDLPADPTFDVQFKASTPDDVVEYGYSVRSISEAGYDFLVQTELFGEDGEIQIKLPKNTASVDAGGRADIFPAGSFPIGDLDPGLYRLEFTLSQNGVVQDIKYVSFRLAERGFTPQIPIGTLKQAALCRKGPGTAYAVVTGFETMQKLALVGVNAERTWGKFEAEVSGSKFQCWISLNLLELQGDTNVPVLAAPPPEAAPVCQRDVNQSACSAAGGTWKFTFAGVGYCDCP